MKKYLLICFFALQLSNIHSQTNRYFPFPDSNAVWCDSICGEESFFISLDTIVGIHTYHKLIQNLHSCQIGAGGGCNIYSCNYQLNKYAGGIRQDTGLRKVYFLAAYDTSEVLLCDFSLNVGDTVKTYNTLPLYPNSVVTSIDSILIGAQYRKRWTVYMQGCLAWYSQIIEGIGSTFGLLDQRYPHGLCRTYGKLYCFSQNDQTLYPNYSPSTGCTKVTGINVYFPAESLSVYPNPTNNQFFIDANTYEKLNVDLYDLNGRQILSRTVHDKSTVDVKDLENGIYTITIRSANFTTNKKLVIIR